MELICVTGIDGAGKSTLAKNVVSELRSKGRDAVYVYGRSVPVVSRILMSLGRFAFLRRQSPQNDFHGYTLSKKRVMRNPILRGVYTAATLFDFYIQVWVKQIGRAS